MLTRSTLHRKILCVIPAFAAITILPIAIYRVIQADWMIATLDFCLFFLMLVIGYNAFKNNNIDKLKKLFCLLAITGTLATIHLKGAGQIYWSFPTIAIIFYLLKVKLAFIVSIISIISYTVLMSPLVSLFTTVILVITQVVTAACAFAFSYETNKQNKELIRLTRSDPLTQAYNRRAFNEILQSKLDEFQRHPEPTSMILLDIDYFKQINDQFGHQQGDEVLQQLCECIMLRLRKSDHLFRVGGEEFVILPHHSDLEQSRILADAIRAAIQAYCFIENHPITISCGVSEYKDKTENLKDWYARTDKALYRAKTTRNQVCVTD
ncbi:GGDEF domain-containing protein [Colwelliaceae bacterium 6441]